MENENEKQDARDREEEEERVTLTWTIEKYREKGQGKVNHIHINCDMSMNLPSPKIRSTFEWIKTRPHSGLILNLLRDAQWEYGGQERVFGFGGILAIKAGNKCLRPRSIKMAQWTWICPAERGTKCRKQLWMQRSEKANQEVKAGSPKGIRG